MIYNAKEEKLDINGVKMDYITFGKGIKPLVMIQGLNTNGIKGAAVSLAYMYRIFAKDFKVYLFDRRENITEHITIKDLAEDTALAMDTLGIKDACILGVSQGGMIAQYLAVNRPDLVNKLVLAVTLSKNNDTVVKVVNSWIEMTQQRDYKSLVKDMAQKMYSDEYVKRYKLFMPLLTALQKPKNEQRFITLAKSCLTCDIYEDLNKINCPVFVIGGGKDKVVTAEASEEIAQKLNCKIYMYDNLGHAAYEEAKDFNKKVYTFFMNN